MSKRAYFKFFPREFLADTADLTNEQRWVYFRLLCQQFINGSALVNDAHKLTKIVSLRSQRWHKVWPHIAHLFVVKDGMLYNERMAKDLKQIIDISEKRKAAIAKRWESKQDTNVIQMNPKQDTNVILPTTNNQLPTTNNKTNHSSKHIVREEDKGKHAPPRKHFVKPKLEEINAFFENKGHADYATEFFNYYESNGWRVGKNPMQKWKAAANNWIQRESRYGTHKQTLRKSAAERCRSETEKWLKGEIPE